MFSAWFGDNLVVPTSIPEPHDDDGLVIEATVSDVADPASVVADQ